MIPDQTRNEMEQQLGAVPSFMEGVADPAVEHAWGLMRDFELAETELADREKALVGLGVASAIGCPYCTRFHTAEAELVGLSEDEMKEAVSIASGVQFFSTVLHGAEVDMAEFAEETDGIIEHLEQQHAAAGDD